jgi:hypothetical protein
VYARKCIIFLKNLTITGRLVQLCTNIHDISNRYPPKMQPSSLLQESKCLYHSPKSPTDGKQSIQLQCQNKHVRYQSLKFKLRTTKTVEVDLGGKACDVSIVNGKGISQHGIKSLITLAVFPLGKKPHTGGIWLGSSTSFVIISSPLSNGQSKSTFLTCSHRSTVCLIRVMMLLYLT